MDTWFDTYVQPQLPNEYRSATNWEIGKAWAPQAGLTILPASKIDPDCTVFDGFLAQGSTDWKTSKGHIMIYILFKFPYMTTSRTRLSSNSSNSPIIKAEDTVIDTTCFESSPSCTRQTSIDSDSEINLPPLRQRKRRRIKYSEQREEPISPRTEASESQENIDELLVINELARPDLEAVGPAAYTRYKKNRRPPQKK